MSDGRAIQETTANRSDGDRVVVGVGVGAGGIAATSELLHELGGGPGIAVVIVNSLESTDDDGGLVDSLARRTTLPVQMARDGGHIESNHVYVVPQKTALTISDGTFVRAPPIAAHGVDLPIDRVFASLAADLTVYALGVVLTGVGADGTAGVEIIKASGGITFAQDATAEDRSMPESAVASGSVDFVLSPKAIARELARIGEREQHRAAGTDDAPAFLRVIAALRRDSGIDFASYKQTTLRRRVQRRFVISKLTSLREYAELVERDAAEATALSEEVLIHVTSFFRDVEAFAALKTLVFSKLVEGRLPTACIRVWIPACSTGEEVYSIAMSLLEFFAETNAPAVSMRLFGTDVSTMAINTARAGKYPARIALEVSPARLQRFFLKQEDGYQIKNEVRDLCVFARHDATRDPPFAGMDLISCRNLFIYLGSALQDRILPIFHYALRESGFLMLGTSETIRAFPGFAVLDAKNRIYVRSAASPRLVYDFFGQRAAQNEVLFPPAGPINIPAEADRVVLAEYAPPGVVITDELAVIQFRGRTGPFLDPAPGVPSFDLFRIVREDLRLPLRQAIDEARSAQVVVRRTCATGSAPEVEIEVIPLRLAATPQRFFVVLFRDLALRGVSLTPTAGDPVAPSNFASQLQQELVSTRGYLRSIVEQGEAANEELKAANEEIVSSNEELRSINEELQMAKEELQSTNEELGTLNDELNVRNLEVMELNDDLNNVLSSVEVPIILLGRDSRIRRYTPAAGELFELGAHGVGRAVASITVIVGELELAQMIAMVLQKLAPMQITVQDARGRSYQLVVRPYLTRDNRVDGTVIMAFDVDATKKAERLLGDAALRRTESGFRDMLMSAAAPILITDENGRIRFANHMAVKTFAFTAAELTEMSVEALMSEPRHGREAALRAELGAHPSRRQVERGRDFIGRRKDGTTFPLEVVTCPMQHEQDGALWVNFIADITDRKASEQRLRDNQEQLHAMAFDASLTEDRERRRIACDLHDSVGQSLALAQIKLTSMRELVNGPARHVLDEAVALIAHSIEDTRSLIFDLSPPVLHDLGLVAAIHWLIEQRGQQQGFHVVLAHDGAEILLDDATASLVFRAVRELLANAFKHAHSPSASVRLRWANDELTIDVEDEGVGFDASKLERPASGTGFGLLSVREQIRRLGGTFALVSSPSCGTQVSIQIPISPRSKHA